MTWQSRPPPVMRQVSVEEHPGNITVRKVVQGTQAPYYLVTLRFEEVEGARALLPSLPPHEQAPWKAQAGGYVAVRVKPYGQTKNPLWEVTDVALGPKGGLAADMEAFFSSAEEALTAVIICFRRWDAARRLGIYDGSPGKMP